MAPVTYQEGVLIHWTPRVAWQQATRGVRVGDRDIPRRVVLRKLLDVTVAWFRWTTALPGDRYLDFRRDLIVEVAGGMPKARTMRVVVREATRYPWVQAHGLEPFLDLPEPCPYEWGELFPWSWNDR